MPPILHFPPQFLWGVATAAHQNEGGNTNNQWAAWEQQPGRIFSGHQAGQATGWRDLEVAAADFDRAAELGLNSLRLSVEWSRIEPEPGRFDDDALAYYRRLIGLLHERGLLPMVTLHHFTDPLWLTALGGWENPLAADYFVRFVGRVVEALGDQVGLWCTINEPNVYAFNGYHRGYFPPGVRNFGRMVKVLRTMLLAHGRAYRTIHRLQEGAQVGLVHHFRVFLPADPARSADQRAAALADQIGNRCILEAALRGRFTFPLGLGQTVSYLLDTADFIGLNYYSTAHVAFDLTAVSDLGIRQFLDPRAELSQVTFAGEPYSEVNPHGLYLALQRLAAYGKPIYITETGVPDASDALRPRFIVTHVAEAWRALQAGVDLRGFYHWTLADNFEWADGWGLRFGLFELDPETGTRTPRTSAAVYSRIAQANGLPLSLLEKLAPGYSERLQAGDGS